MEQCQADAAVWEANQNQDGSLPMPELTKRLEEMKNCAIVAVEQDKEEDRRPEPDLRRCISTNVGCGENRNEIRSARGAL
jgi:hypothetical protein